MEHVEAKPVFDKKGRFKRRKKSVTDWLYKYPVFVEMINSLKTMESRKNYAYALNRFFHHIDMNPDEFVALEDHEIYNKVTDYFRHVERKDRASLGNHTEYAVKKLLKRVGKKLEIDPEDALDEMVKKTTDLKHIPSKQDIFTMIDYTNNTRDKALLLCLFQSGLRIGSLLQLKYGMIKDWLYDSSGKPLELVDKNGIKHDKLPIVIRISKRRIDGSIYDGKVAKATVTYYTFLALEAAMALQDLIEWRKREEGWTPQDEHFIFTSQGYKRGGKHKPMEYFWNRHLDNSNILKILKTIAKRIGIPREKIWLHLFRYAFQKHCDGETGDPTFSQVLMGHKLKEGVTAHRYGDYGDTENKRVTYMNINWSRSTVHRVWELEKNAKDRNNKIKGLKDEVNELKDKLGEKDELLEMQRLKIKDLMKLRDELQVTVRDEVAKYMASLKGEDVPDEYEVLE